MHPYWLQLYRRIFLLLIQISGSYFHWTFERLFEHHIAIQFTRRLKLPVSLVRSFRENQLYSFSVVLYFRYPYSVTVIVIVIVCTGYLFFSLYSYSFFAFNIKLKLVTCCPRLNVVICYIRFKSYFTKNIVYFVCHLIICIPYLDIKMFDSSALAIKEFLTSSIYPFVVLTVLIVCV